MNRPPDAEIVSGGDLYGLPSEMAIYGVLRGGYYRDNWFYTVDGTGAFRMPCPKGILKPIKEPEPEKQLTLDFGS